MDTIAERIRWILNERGWSQRHLSEGAGFTSPSQLGNILRRLDEKPDAIEMETARAIARGANVSVNWLLTGEGTPGDDSGLPPPPPPRELVVVPDGESLSVPVLRNYPGWEELCEAVRALDPKIPDWVYEDMEKRSPFLAGALHPAAVRDFARVIWKHSVPPSKTAAGAGSPGNAQAKKVRQKQG